MWNRNGGEKIARELLSHKEKKGSNVKWFIIAIIPIINLYYMWKAAENISGHEKVIEKFESLDHPKPKGSTGMWFVIMLIPTVLGILAAPVMLGGFMVGGMALGMGLAVALVVVAIAIGLYILWKLAEVISGHESVYETYETLGHEEKKGSTAKWFVIGLIPIVNLYFIWKMGWVISAHESVYE